MKIYDAAILALTELNKPARIEEILEVIKHNHWFTFNTANETNVLSLSIKRRTVGYKSVQASKKKNFVVNGDLFALLEEPELKDNSRIKPDDLYWKIQRKIYIGKIRKVLRANKLALFLGSGVSMSAGIPTWNMLLEKINESVFREMKSNIVDGKLKNFQTNENEDSILANLLSRLGDDSPIVNASFLQSALGSTAAMSKEIRSALYGTRKKTFSSATLKWLAKLCNHRGSYQIQGVVTFNYDDLLEQHLKDIPVTFMPIFKEEDEIEPDNLPIYHVHGYLPQYNKLHDSYPLVLTEQSYHNVYTEAYSWSNITQLLVLKENTCLFVGLSMNDPNMRRILDIAARKNHSKVKHYALMQRLDLVVGEEQLKEVSEVISAKLLEAFLDDFHMSREKHYENLGVQIVWFEDLGEIPQIIKMLVD